MATLTIDFVFEGVSDDDLAAVYDQTDAIKVAAEKAARKLPIGRYLTEVVKY